MRHKMPKTFQLQGTNALNVFFAEIYSVTLLWIYESILTSRSIEGNIIYADKNIIMI